MIRIFQWLRKEFQHVLPAFIFFLAFFSLINMTEGRMLRDSGVPTVGFLTILVAAAIVAKVLVIVDHLPFIDLFPKKPLIYNVIWKTIIYGISSLIVRLIFRLAPFLWASESFSLGYRNFIGGVYWLEFWAVQAWYIVLFTVYVIFRELIIAVGREKVRRIFFGK